MPRAFASDDDADMIQAERDVAQAFDGLVLDLGALAAVSNIFRAATAVRNHIERRVLDAHGLSWSAFTVLFVLRVWGEHESRQLAEEAGITGGTLTGVLKTLERKGLAERREHHLDRRRVVVTATPAGAKVVDEIMPALNQHEALVSMSLDEQERHGLATALRKILRTVERLDGSTGTRVSGAEGVRHGGPGGVSVTSIG